jgi:hypothetical protein
MGRLSSDLRQRHKVLIRCSTDKVGPNKSSVAVKAICPSGHTNKFVAISPGRRSPNSFCVSPRQPCYHNVMPRFLPAGDFRARRRVLTREDFAYAPKPAPPASDLIDKDTWESIVTLPDDVAVRSSDYHGTAFAQLNDLWGAWVECIDGPKSSLSTAMLDAADDFQAATYAALTGFYRLSIAALRSALELVAIGTWAEVCNAHDEFDHWREGKAVLSFGRACDGLIAATESLRNQLRATVNDSLFDQKDSAGEGGFARRIFSGISDFSHSRPGSADGDMRGSHGPIYVRSALEHAAWIHFEVIGLCFVLVIVARPKLAVAPCVSDLFADVCRVKSKVTRAAFEELSGASR